MERKESNTESKPAVAPGAKTRSIVPVLRRVRMKAAEDDIRDWQYWLSQPVIKRAEAVTFLVTQMLEKGQRMDKRIVNRIKL